MEQNRDTEIGAHKYAQMTFDKSANTIQWRKDIAFSAGGPDWTSAGKRNEP